MDDQLLTAVVGGLAGLVSGAIASVVAPWVNWGIEKRRLRLQRRQELVDEWRTGLAEAESEGLFGHSNYQHLPWYQSLEPHLNQRRKGRWVKGKVKTIWYRFRDKPLPKPATPPSRTFVVTEEGGRNGEAVRIAVQIQHLAKKWRLE